MELYLNKIFNSNELSDKTIEYYLDYNNNLSFENVFGLSSKLFFKNFDKEKFLYELLGENYRNEYYVKRFFIIDKLLKNSECFYEEMIVGNSRCDLLSFYSDKSYCFEIKTKYDNLNRLNKQLNDYRKYFNYIYVLCHVSEINNLSINDSDGIYVYDDHSKKVRLYKKAHLNKEIDKQSQLSIFSKKDLFDYFGTDNIKEIINKHSSNQINKKFIHMSTNKHHSTYEKLRDECLRLSE